MTSLYRILLQLYPKHIRDEFGDEMLAVFEAATQDGGGLWFLLRECGGMVRGAAQERSVSPLWIPVAGGLAITLVIQGIAYTLFGGILNGVSRRLTSAEIQDEQLTAGIMAVAALLVIVPVVVLVCRQTQLRLDKSRFDYRRLHAHR